MKGWQPHGFPSIRGARSYNLASERRGVQSENFSKNHIVTPHDQIPPRSISADIQVVAWPVCAIAGSRGTPNLNPISALASPSRTRHLPSSSPLRIRTLFLRVGGDGTRATIRFIDARFCLLSLFGQYRSRVQTPLGRGPGMREHSSSFWQVSAIPHPLTANRRGTACDLYIPARARDLLPDPCTRSVPLEFGRAVSSASPNNLLPTLHIYLFLVTWPHSRHSSNTRIFGGDPNPHNARFQPWEL